LNAARLIRIFGSYIAACALAALVLSLTGVPHLWSQAPNLFHFLVIASLQLASIALAITPFAALAAALPALLLFGFGEYRRIWSPYYYTGTGSVIGILAPALLATSFGKSVSVDASIFTFAVSGFGGGYLYWRLAIWTPPAPPTEPVDTI
jgi:hypothetical protein